MEKVLCLEAGAIPRQGTSQRGRAHGQGKSVDISRRFSQSPHYALSGHSTGRAPARARAYSLALSHTRGAWQGGWVRADFIHAHLKPLSTVLFLIKITDHWSEQRNTNLHPGLTVIKL